MEPSRGEKIVVIMPIAAQCFDILRLSMRLSIKALLGIAFWVQRGNEALLRQRVHSGCTQLARGQHNDADSTREDWV